MAMLDPATQLTTIQESGFFTALRTELQTITAAMETNSFSINGDVLFEVEEVPVAATLTSGSTDVEIAVGQDQNGNPFYTWKAPAGWVAPPPPAPAP